MIDNKFENQSHDSRVVVVAQLVRASDCGSEGCRFESGLPPHFVFVRSIRKLDLTKVLSLPLLVKCFFEV